MTVSLIAVPDIDKFWPFLRSGFEDACLATGGGMTSADLWVQCRSGAAFLTVVHEDEEILGAAVFCPENWTSGRKLRCRALFGTDLASWFDDMKAMAARLAVDTGATALVTEGRIGWKRLFPKAKVLRILIEEAL